VQKKILCILHPGSKKFGPLKSLVRIVDGESLKSVDFVRETQRLFRVRKGVAREFLGL